MSDRPRANGQAIEECVALIRRTSTLEPAVGVILGSGLGPVADRIATEGGGAVFATADLPHWPRSTVPGHEGRLVLGRWSNQLVVALRGRTHAYEGYALDRVTFPHRVFAALGVRTLIVTNAVGTMNRSFAPGELMLVRDHVNWIGRRGLFTKHELRDATPVARGAFAKARPYTPAVARVLREAARERGITLREGVLLAVKGPAYETAAEIRMARKIGADAVCMSSAHEIDLAAALGLATGAISCITNYTTGLSPHPLAHGEVEEVAGRAAAGLEGLLATALEGLAGAAGAASSHAPGRP